MLLYLGNKLSVHGYTPTSVETLGVKLKECDKEIITGSSKKNKLLRLADMLWLVFKFRKNKPVVFIDTYSTSAFWFSYYVSRLCLYYKIPYVPILRGGDLPDRLDRSKQKCQQLFLYSYANIAASNYLHHEFSKRGLSVQTIHNYIDIKNYPYKTRNKVVPKLLWVRAFHTIYNPKLAILAFAKIQQLFPDATLTMVGPDKDGSMKQCRSIAQKLNVHVTFTGKLSKQEWLELSESHDLFINTTHIDNTPISVMEAMALGMPVISTNAGGIPYLFENGTEGIMIIPDDVDALVQAVTKLFDSPDIVKLLSENARSKALQWDWEVVKPKWCNLIKSAAAINQ